MTWDKLAVIGKEEKALGIIIKPSCREKALFQAGEEVYHRGSPLGIPRSGDDPFWFVEHHGDL